MLNFSYVLAVSWCWIWGGRRREVYLNGLCMWDSELWALLNTPALKFDQVRVLTLLYPSCRQYFNGFFLFASSPMSLFQSRLLCQMGSFTVCLIIAIVVYLALPWLFDVGWPCVLLTDTCLQATKCSSCWLVLKLVQCKSVGPFWSGWVSVCTNWMKQEERTTKLDWCFVSAQPSIKGFKISWQQKIFTDDNCCYIRVYKASRT